MPRVTELWAYVIADSNEDDEGVPAWFNPIDGTWNPLVGADRERCEQLRERAQQACDMIGKPVSLRRSTGMEEIDVLYPRGGNGAH